ncbi:MAG: class IV adenylate cyclase [Candidatus Nealsonbacteria bacterium]|nr:class IV adenylate cyclase [Candidatus Nealsonbacteria bacterium]
MHKEVELQVTIKNSISVEKKLRKVGKFIKTRRQVDKYFVPPQRDFFEREPYIEYLRIRFEKEKNHLNYSFLHFGKDGWLRVTDEYETFIDKPKIVEEIFKKIGLIPKVTVIKTRKYFDCNNFEVILDQVKGLGNFMEIEAKKNFGGIQKTRKACLDFLKKLNIKYEMQAQMGYPRMLYQKLKKKNNAKN